MVAHRYLYGESMKTESDPNQVTGTKRTEYAETQPPRDDLKERRGGPQTDQGVGEADEGAHNQDAKGRNPQGNDKQQSPYFLLN